MPSRQSPPCRSRLFDKLRDSESCLFARRELPRRVRQTRTPLRSVAAEASSSPHQSSHRACKTFRRRRRDRRSRAVFEQSAHHFGEGEITICLVCTAFPFCWMFTSLAFVAAGLQTGAVPAAQDAARASNSVRSREFSASEAARANSDCASERRPTFFSRSARTAGSK
jgi:hypothetical protein